MEYFLDLEFHWLEIYNAQTFFMELGGFKYHFYNLIHLATILVKT